MPSIPRVVLQVGVGLLIVGLLVGGLGVAIQGTDDCQSGYGLTVRRLGPNESATTNGQVAYENLTASEKRVFDEARTGGNSPIYPNDSAFGDVAGKLVTYQGHRYETVEFVADCGSPGVVYIFGGGALTVVGAVVAALGWLFGRFRG